MCDLYQAACKNHWTTNVPALPEERTQPSPPFTYSGCDIFGQFMDRDRSREEKRYEAWIFLFYYTKKAIMKILGWPYARESLWHVIPYLFFKYFIGTLQYAAPNRFNLFEYYTGLKLKSKLPGSVNITTCKNVRIRGCQHRIGEGVGDRLTDCNYFMVHLRLHVCYIAYNKNTLWQFITYRSYLTSYGPAFCILVPHLYVYINFLNAYFEFLIPIHWGPCYMRLWSSLTADHCYFNHPFPIKALKLQDFLQFTMGLKRLLE